MVARKRWLSLLWGAGVGLGVASYLWGTSAGAALVAGDKVIFTLVIPLAALFLCLAVSFAAAGGGAGPPPRR
jgi:hypothetical protein